MFYSKDIFNYHFYLDKYKDIKIDNEKKARNHFIKKGIKECKFPCLNFSYFTNIKQYQLINILINFNGNESSYNLDKCLNSILNQNYPNYKIFIGINDVNQKNKIEKYYLFNKKIKIFNFKLNNLIGNLNNQYYNYILNEITEGWFIILKENDYFKYENSLLYLCYNFLDQDCILIWNIKNESKTLYSNHLNNLDENNFILNSLCLHNKLKDQIKLYFKYNCEFNLLKNLLDKNSNLKLIWINYFLIHNLDSLKLNSLPENKKSNSKQQLMIEDKLSELDSKLNLELESVLDTETEINLKPEIDTKSIIEPILEFEPRQEQELKLSIDPNTKKGISIICYTQTPSFHYNILETILNLQSINYDLELLICVNSKFLNKKYYHQFFNENQIKNNIIELDNSSDENLNILILQTNYNLILKINDHDIYIPGLIDKCLPFLDIKPIISSFKTTIYYPGIDTFYINEKNIDYSSIYMFDKRKVHNINQLFIDENDTKLFLTQNQLTLLDLSQFYIQIRQNDKSIENLKIIKPTYLFDKYIRNYGLFTINDSLLIDQKLLDNESNYKSDFKFKKLNIIGIFDEFLYNSYKTLFNIKLVVPTENITKKYSFFFCESCWEGNVFYGLEKFRVRGKKNKSLINIINQCNILKIPTIFYNKEDPVSFEDFITNAKYFDVIITTDINCVERYKKLTKSIIFVMPFNINPLSINNIGRNNDNNESFFAGSYYYHLSNERKINTDILIKKLATKDNMILFDRKLYTSTKNNNTLNMFHPKYNKYLHKPLSHKNILQIHLQKNWCGNLNTVKESYTMFARRIIEGSIMKNSLVTDYSLGVYKYFEHSIYRLEDELNYNTNQDILMNQIKKQIGWRTVITNYNSYQYFSVLFEKINITRFINPFSKQDQITIICITNTVKNYSHIIKKFNSQKYNNKQLIIVFNQPYNQQIENIYNNNKQSNIIIKHFDPKHKIDYCLNQIINLSSGSIISIFNDSDFYGENYLIDMYHSMIISKSHLVGKCAHMVYLSDKQKLWIKFYNLNYENYTYQSGKCNFLCKSTFFFKKKIFNKCYFVGEDIESIENNFLESVKINGFTIYASDFFNYCKILPISDNLELLNSIYINQYDQFPLNLIDI